MRSVHYLWTFTLAHPLQSTEPSCLCSTKLNPEKMHTDSARSQAKMYLERTIFTQMGRRRKRRGNEISWKLSLAGQLAGRWRDPITCESHYFIFVKNTSEKSFGGTGNLNQHITKSKSKPFESILHWRSWQTGGVVWSHKLPALETFVFFLWPLFWPVAFKGDLRPDKVSSKEEAESSKWGNGFFFC